MKKLILINIFLLALASIAFALDADLEKHATCSYCGMDRAKYAHSRMVIEYDDGTSFGPVVSTARRSIHRQDAKEYQCWRLQQQEID